MINQVALQGLCDRCQTIDIAKYLVGRDVTDNVELGYYQDIAKNDHCSLCKLVIQALSFQASPYWKPGKYPVEMCYLGRHVDHQHSSQATLDVWFDATSETLPDRIRGHHTCFGRVHVLELESHLDNLPRGYKPMARLIEEQLSISFVQTWIEDCENHPRCNAFNSNSAYSAMNETVPLLLIDVKRMRLAQCAWDCRYLALSYVWGRAKQYQTLQSNFKDLSTDGSLLRVRESLPRTIRDAIDLVIALGESYLWVDTLCIIQDDVESRDRYISRMDKIYGQSLFTIVALAGQDANAPLPGFTAGSRKQLSQPVHLGSFKLLCDLPSLSSYKQLSTWSSRAWTFQEGILSKRCLYFAETQLYWQCVTSYRAESYAGELHDGQVSFGGFNALARETGNEPRQQFNAYESLVKNFSPRELTYQSDSLKAFVGVLSAIKHSTGWDFASALPETLLDLALLWRPLRGSRLRKEKLQMLGEASQGPACDSPSWCWTAWTGYNYWDPWYLDSYAGKRIKINPEVAVYFLRSEIGSRKIIRAQTLSQGRYKVDFGMAYELTDILGETQLGDIPLNALVFEAGIIPIVAYKLSSPLPESSWKLTRLVSYQFKDTLSGQLWIYDSSGHHCGTMDGLRSWDSSLDAAAYDFVLLSRNDQDEVTQVDVDNFQSPLPPAEEYYEQIFDRDQFKYKRRWSLNILLIRWDKGIAERVAVGQMHVDAWASDLEQKKVIILR